MLPQPVAQDTPMLSGPSSATIFTWVTIETRSAPLLSGALVATFSVHQFENNSLLVRSTKVAPGKPEALGCREHSGY